MAEFKNLYLSLLILALILFGDLSRTGYFIVIGGYTILWAVEITAYVLDWRKTKAKREKLEAAYARF